MSSYRSFMNTNPDLKKKYFPFGLEQLNQLVRSSIIKNIPSDSDLVGVDVVVVVNKKVKWPCSRPSPYLQPLLSSV